MNTLYADLYAMKQDCGYWNKEMEAKTTHHEELFQIPFTSQVL